MIPKVVYTYWNSKQLPPIATHCIETWKRLNPDFQIVVVNPDYVFTHMNPPRSFLTMIPQWQADWVRINLLAKHGGVWMDATIYCFKKLDSWINFNSNQLFVFNPPPLTTKFSTYMYENWTFACPPHHDFVNQWQLEYNKSVNMGMDRYITELKHQNRFPQFDLRLPYFTMHLCSGVVIAGGTTAEVSARSCCNVVFPCTYLGWVGLFMSPAPKYRIMAKVPKFVRQHEWIVRSLGLYTLDSEFARALQYTKDPWPARLRTILVVLTLLLLWQRRRDRTITQLV